MRKIVMTAAAILLILTMAVNGYAAEEKMTLSDAEGIPGATVYLTMTLQESVKGDALAVSYTYDPELLEPLIDSHAWSKTGMLQDFDYKHVGVWADSSVSDFNGPVCVLAFRIRDGKTFQSTKVGCTLMVKNGASDAGTYTAEATVSMACSHVFGNWIHADAFNHTRACETCGQKQTQSHIWDEGVLTDNPENERTEIKTYTCTECGGTRQVEVSSELEEQVPTVPGEQEPIPTIPPSSAATMPKETQPQPTNPDYSGNQGNQGNGGNQGGSQNQGSANNQGGSNNSSGSQNQGNTNSNGGGSHNQPGSNDQTGGNSQGNPGNQGSGNTQGSFVPQEDPAETQQPMEPEHDHSHGEETVPIAIPVVTNPNATTDPPATEHDHVHEEEITEQRIAPASVVAMAAFFAAAAGGLLIFLKKKR